MEGISQGIPEKRRSAAAEGRVADREFAAFHQETLEQKSAAEAADRLALLGVRLNLIRGEIATAEQQGKPEEEIAKLRKLAEEREQEMLAMSKGSSN